MTWRTDSPPTAVEIELVTDAGKTLTGEVSFVATGQRTEGSVWTNYMLWSGKHPIFQVAKWRRAE